jgi:hypothetical protein
MPTLLATPCPRGPVVVSTPDVQRYWMAWAFAVELPKALDVLERHGGLSERFVLAVNGFA